MAGANSKGGSGTPKIPSETSDGSSFVTKWLGRAVLLCFFFAMCSWLDAIKHRWYVFTPEFLHELAQDAIASAPAPDDIHYMINHIVSNLTATYPSDVVALNANSSEWMFNNAGGAMGAMYIIHASITEYLIIFGTPLGTEGHSSVLAADNYFNILVGEEWAFDPPKLEREVYPPGSLHYLPRGHMKQYKMHEGCFALEYARGWIPLMLPFGAMDALTSTLDYKSFYRTAVITGREMFRNLALLKI
ncbi:unnamed protein product [Somion occarium]|uniref:C-8 sterol isomerase n=1 Tax=Somion occarium TaxID=3059160 RepID=A0ABP1DGB3_9APHY